MVCLASCDKTSPGQLMAAARLNIPTIVVVCGYQQSGEYNGQHVDIEEGNPVVFIGPNNSGKTTALQAIALWEVGLRRSTINRKDLFAVPVPNTNLLWKDLQVQECPNRDCGRGRDRGPTLDVRPRLRICQRGIALLPVAGEHRRPAGGVHGSGRVPRADVGPGGP